MDLFLIHTAAVQFKQEKKTRGSLSQEKREALRNLLMVTVLKMKYPATYNFANPGDDEEIFNETRLVRPRFFRLALSGDADD